MGNRFFLNVIASIILLFGSDDLIGQNDYMIKINGKISTTSESLHDINIVNLRTKEYTVSNLEGNFWIDVKVNDTLNLSSVQLKNAFKIITEKDISNHYFIVKMEEKTTILDEVDINKHKNFNSLALGTQNRVPKSYTPAERHLKTASEFKPTMLLGGIFGGSLPIDPILNAISGRTKMLKKEVEVEKKEMAFEKLDYLFDDSYFIQVLKIPADYLNGFKYYIVEDAELTKALKVKNKTMAKFIMTDLSVKYLKLINGK